MTNETVTVRLTPPQKKVVADLASQLNVTQAEIVRRAIRQYGLLRKYDPKGKCLYNVLRKAIDDEADKAALIWWQHRKKSQSSKH